MSLRAIAGARPRRSGSAGAYARSSLWWLSASWRSALLNQPAGTIGRKVNAVMSNVILKSRRRLDRGLAVIVALAWCVWVGTAQSASAANSTAPGDPALIARAAGSIAYLTTTYHISI